MVKHKLISFTRGAHLEVIKSNLSNKGIDPSTIDLIGLPPSTTEDECCEAVKGATAILKGPRGPYLSRRILEAAKGIKLVQFGSVGYEAVDLVAATDLGIPVANNPGWNAISVAEHAVMTMLVLLKRAFYVHNAITEGRWVHDEIAPPGGMRQIYELHGKTVGILGLGSIGTEVAKRAVAFGARIIYNKRNRLSEADEIELGVEYLPFHQMLEQSDILTVHVPHTSETEGMIGSEEIRKMKKGAILINTARRDIVDEAALAEALRDSHLAGAGIDVPRSPDEVTQLQEAFAGIKNVLLTPHTATAMEAMGRANQQITDNLYRLFSGEKPWYLVNDVWE